MADDALDAARRRLGLSYIDLWLDYFALGGSLDVGGLTGCLRGERHLVSDTDHNVIVHALNERFRDQGDDNPLAYRGP